jgi:anti-sigma B factor antagonist
MPRLELLPGSRRPPDSLLGLGCWSIDDDPDALCLHAVGELDIATAPQLQRALADALEQARLVVLDLRDLGFIDSSGVHVIVDASCRAREIGRRLVLVRGYEVVDRMFSLAGSLGHLDTACSGLTEPPIARQVADRRLTG